MSGLSVADPIIQLIDTLNSKNVEPYWPQVIAGDHWILGTTGGLISSDSPTTEYADQYIFPPTLDASYLYLASKQGLLIKASIEASESPLWQRSFEDWVFPPVISNNMVYANTRKQGVYGLDQHTGKTIWQWSLAEEPVYSPFLVSNQWLGVTNYSAELLLISLVTGELSRTITLPVISKFGLMSDENHLLLTGIDGSLLILDLDTFVVTQIPAGKQLLTPVLNDESAIWLLEGKANILKLNKSDMALKSIPIPIKNTEHLIQIDNQWKLISKNKGTYSIHTLSM